MIPRSPGRSTAASRQTFEADRARVLAVCLGLLVALAGLAALLAGPAALGALRLFGVGLGWWAVPTGGALVLAGLAVGDRAHRPPGDARTPDKRDPPGPGLRA